MHLLFAALMLRHWLVVSDLHVMPHTSAHARVRYGTDSTWALFDSTVAQMRKVDPNPGVVIVSGDFLRHKFPDNVPLAERTMKRIVRTFDAAFPRAQFVIVPGNNDDPCGDYRATPGDPYFAYIARLWAPLVDRRGASPDFERDFGRYGWYQARLPGSSLRAFALDSVYWSFVYRACGNYTPNAPQRQLQWLSGSLASLNGRRRAVLVMHIPPGVDASTTIGTHRLLVVPFMNEAIAAKLVPVLQRYASRIAFAQAGHVHRDGFRFFGGVPMLIAPSVSPIYKNNPAFLVLDLAADGTLQDYTPYDFDVPTQTWRKGASFDATYGVKAFTASSLASIHARLRTDPALRRRWSAMYVSGSRYRDIVASTWRTYWCAQNRLAGAFVDCAGLQRRVEVLPIAGGIVLAGLLALGALLAVRLGRRRRAR